MRPIKEQDNIGELNNILYDRRLGENVRRGRQDLTRKQVDIARGWGEPFQSAPMAPAERAVGDDIPAPVSNNSNNVVAGARAGSPASLPNTAPTTDIDTPAVVSLPDKVPAKKKGTSFRMAFILFSLGLFFIMLMIAGAYFFLNNNQISADNISLDMTVPFSVTGGDIVTTQVIVSNQNTIALESAVLVVSYPSGTKSTVEDQPDLIDERIPLDTLAPGEVRNVPLSFILFGEENEAKEIKTSLEYKVGSSDNTFAKATDPFRVLIGSSPLVLQVSAVQKISSGQEMEMTLSLSSNAAITMKNVLVTGNFPNSFRFISADPLPESGNNTWLLPEVSPDKVYKIKIRGSIFGSMGENAETQFRAGYPRSDSQSVLGSILAQAKVSYQIEKPFVKVVVGINGDKDGEAFIPPESRSVRVVVDVTNTLDEPVYHMRVELMPQGDSVNEKTLSVGSGYYDVADGSIRWDLTGMRTLEKVGQGESRNFSFELTPELSQPNSTFNVSAKIYARRVNDVNASEEVIGSAVAEGKYATGIKLLPTTVSHLSGPLPPVAGQDTTYAVVLGVEAGLNGATGITLSTSFPQVTEWLDKTSGDGNVEFNPITKRMRWNVGDIAGGDTKQLRFEVKIKPSITSVGNKVLLMERQTLEAKDAFTDLKLSAQGSQVFNTLTDSSEQKDSDKVVRSAGD